MESNRLNIGVMGWWHYGNQGDSALLENMTRAWTPHHIVPIDLPFPFHEDLLERLNLLDFLILGGGGLFQGTLPPPFDTFDTWGRQLETPIGVAGVGVDQVLIEYRFLMTALIEQARFFYVRDLVSQQLLGHPKVRVVPDLTFLYPLEATAGTRALSQDSPVCGVNLRRVPGLEVGRWIEALRGLPVRLRGIPFSTYDVWREVQILRQLDAVCAGTFDPGLYAGLDLMVGTAFHSVVFAIQAAVPVIAIAYAPKVRRLMREVGLQDYVLELNEWQKLTELIERAIDERERLVDHLREMTTALTKSAWQAIADMREEIERTAQQCTPLDPKVSIVVVGSASDTANQRTLVSCLNQTYKDVEVIFAGDGAQVQRDPPTPSLSELKIVPSALGQNLGERLNCAFAHATGEYRSWTVGGNLYARDAIACMVNRLQREPACDMVYADYYTVHRTGRIADGYSVYSACKLFRRNVVGPCFLYRRKLAEIVGTFGTDTPLAAYDYWLRAHQMCRLQPMHVPLFYASTSNMAGDLQVERQVRRRWRSTRLWLLRVFWGVADAEFVEHLVVRPLMTTLRKVGSLLQCLEMRRWIERSYRALSVARPSQREGDDR